MTATHDPSLVGDELLRLTRSLGAVDKDLAILAEGNTSQLLDDGRLVVKASGSRMRDATSADFVTVDLPPFVDLLASPNATQADLTAMLDAGVVHGQRVRASIETLLHAAVHAVRPVEFIGHTHPTAVVGLLASVHAATVFDTAAYSDEAVVLGRPLHVPYAQPGLALGQEFHRRLREHVDGTRALPQLVTLGNHGIVALAPTADGVEAISEMAVKAARVRTIAHAIGGVAPLTDDAVEKFFARDDVAERRSNISRGRL